MWQIGARDTTHDQERLQVELPQMSKINKQTTTKEVKTGNRQSDKRQAWAWVTCTEMCSTA